MYWYDEQGMGHQVAALVMHLDRLKESLPPHQDHHILGYQISTSIFITIISSSSSYHHHHIIIISSSSSYHYHHHHIIIIISSSYHFQHHGTIFTLRPKASASRLNAEYSSPSRQFLISFKYIFTTSVTFFIFFPTGVTFAYNFSCGRYIFNF